MEYVTVKEIGKYHPGYKDRTLVWAKIHFKLILNPKYAEIPEVDRFRLIAFICLQLHLQEPVPLSANYLKGIGFDLKRRPIHLTLQMLHNFISTVTEDSNPCTVEYNRVDKSRVDSEFNSEVKIVWDYYLLKTKKALTLTGERRNLILKRLKEGYTIDQIKGAIDKFWADDWAERRTMYWDLPYLMGTIKSVNNLDKWINMKSVVKYG